MTSITYEWEPDPSDLAASLMAVADALDTRVPMMAQTAQIFRMDVAENFEGEHGPDGDPWAPWAESYENYAIENNVGILRQTEELFEEAVSSARFIVSNDAVFYEVDMPVRGAWHQEGVPDRRTKSGAPNPLPARPFLGLSEEAASLIMETWGEWFDGAIMIYPSIGGGLERRHSIRAPGSQGRFVSRASVGKAPLR